MLGSRRSGLEYSARSPVYETVLRAVHQVIDQNRAQQELLTIRYTGCLAPEGLTR